MKTTRLQILIRVLASTTNADRGAEEIDGESHERDSAAEKISKAVNELVDVSPCF